MSCHDYEAVMSVLCTPLQVKCNLILFSIHFIHLTYLILGASNLFDIFEHFVLNVTKLLLSLVISYFYNDVTQLLT